MSAASIFFMVTCHSIDSNSIINDHEVQHRITEECEECNKLKLEIQSLLVSLNSLQLTEETMKCDGY